MNSLAHARTLGGVGSIFILLSIVPCAGVVLFIAGFILVLVAVKYISDVVADKTIFNNMLIAVILAIVGMVAGVAVAVASFFPFFREFRPLYSPSMFIEPGWSLFATLIIALVILWVFYIISAIFLRRSYSTIASKLNISMFDTAALLYLIGAVLAIVLVGFIVIYVAEILQTVAFFSIVEKAQQPSQA